MLRIQVIAESICLKLALATHIKKIKSFDGKRGGSHEMLISDVCHNYQFYCFVCLFVCLLLYVPSQQLWSLRDGQFT